MRGHNKNIAYRINSAELIGAQQNRSNKQGPSRSELGPSAFTLLLCVLVFWGNTQQKELVVSLTLLLKFGIIFLLLVAEYR